MAMSLQFRQHNRDLGMMMREVDEDLAIFLGMRNGEENGRNGHVLVDHHDEFGASKEPKPDPSVMSNVLQPLHRRGCDRHRKVSEDQDSCISQKSERANTGKEFASSVGQKPAPRAAVPTGQPVFPAKPKPFRPSTPTSKATLQSSHMSTPKSRAVLPSSKTAVNQARPTTPAKTASSSKSTVTQARSTTPAKAASHSPMQTGSKPATRPASPSRRPATPSTAIRGSSTCDGSSSERKTSTSTVKSPMPSSRGTLQTVKSNPSRHLEMLALAHDTLQNPKPTVPKRPASASRARASTPAANTLSSHGKPRQTSGSPARIRAAPSSTACRNGNRMLSRSQGYCNGDSEDVNPVLIGTKMVERVVNMRKLIPPKQNECSLLDNARKSSRENAGFGRSLSKTSLDMALRHMDIRRSVVPDKLPAVTTAAPSSSASEIRSICEKGSAAIFPESPLTSCTSESSKSCSSYFLDR